jgi:hypothetical protein
MPPLRDRYYLTMAFFLICGAGLMVAFVYWPWAALGLPILAIVLGGYSVALRCPKCGKPIGVSSYGIGHPWAERTCSRCGYDLTKAA